LQEGCHFTFTDGVQFNAVTTM